MKIMSFSELYTMDYNMSSLIAMNQNWREKKLFVMSSPRPTNALLLFCGCEGMFHSYDGKTLEVPCGSLFYIPAGSKYRWNFTHVGKDAVSTMLFEFLLTNEQGETIEIGESAGIIKISSAELYRDLFRSLVVEFQRPVRSAARIKAASYSLVAEVSGEDRKNCSMNSNIQCIYKGIKHLEEDPKQSKSIKEIAEMCNVSVNYFERLFKEYAGCTPTQYRLQRKLDRAKLMLRNEVLTVQQVAYELNFDDPAYFCRVFKKICGCTPMEYRNYGKESVNI